MATSVDLFPSMAGPMPLVQQGRPIRASEPAEMGGESGI